MTPKSPLKKKKVKVKENDWRIIDQDNWGIKAEHMFRDGSLTIPVYVYMNTKTAEIKIFAKIHANEIGLSNIELWLNPH